MNANIDSANMEDDMHRVPRIMGSIIALVFASEVVGATLVSSWHVDASEVTQATPGQIWAWYSDSARTPNWDYLVARRTMAGPFKTGTTGSNQGSSGPAFPWTFTEVSTDRSYTEVTRLPLATVTATHVLTPVPDGTRIDHALIVRGPLAWLYRLAAYAAFDKGIHEALHRLATGAAKGPPPAHRAA
jgi:hypothetical protein